MNKTVRKILIILGIVILVLVLLALGVFLLIKFWLLAPNGESLALPTLSSDAPIYQATEIPVQELEQIKEDYYINREEVAGEDEAVKPVRKPLCGDQNELVILAVGIDYEGDGYLYGLADVIRVIHIDFTIPQVNVVALPRALLVNVPEDRITVDNPILLNQAYFFGTPGMGHYVGTGYGAGALAEAIQFNFGVTADHYVVVDFKNFAKFVDIMGGIEVDLPAPVDNLPLSYYPAGKQFLSGSEALDVARTRNKSSDFVRIDNQTLVMQAIFDRLKSPSVWIRVPELLGVVKESVIMDIPSTQIDNLICLIQILDKEDIHFFNPPQETVPLDWEYIPSMAQDMQIIRWNADFILWFHESIWYYQQEP